VFYSRPLLERYPFDYGDIFGFDAKLVIGGVIAAGSFLPLKVIEKHSKLVFFAGVSLVALYSMDKILNLFAPAPGKLTA
jgi:hypothetical protein